MNFDQRLEDIFVYGFDSSAKVAAIKWLRSTMLACKGYQYGLREAKDAFDQLERSNRPIKIMEIPADMVGLVKLAGKGVGIRFHDSRRPDPTIIW